MANSLTKKIFYAFLLGIIFGIVLGYLPPNLNIKEALIGFLNFGGEVFFKKQSRCW